MSYYADCESQAVPAKLRAAGVEIDEGRGKGGHVLARYKGRWTTVPVHGSVDLGPNFLK